MNDEAKNDEEKDDRRIVVFVTGGMHLTGMVDKGDEVECGVELVVRNVWQVHGMLAPTPQGGMSQMCICMPVHNAVQPLKQVTVVPQGFYFPDEAGCTKEIEAIVKEANDSALAHRMEAAGLTFAGKPEIKKGHAPAPAVIERANR